MNRVIQLRGWSGSGKSTVIRKLLDQYAPTTVLFEDGKVVAYRLDEMKHKTYIIGPYTKTGGGCDTIHPVARIDELVSRYARRGNVVFEGQMVSTIAGRFIKLADSLSGVSKFIFLILDTPLKVCLRRIKRRRRAKGNLKPFKPTKANLHHYQEARFSSPRNLREGGCDVRVVNHKKAFKTVLKILGEE